MSTKASGRLRIAYVTDAINGGLGGAVVAARYVVDALRKEHDVVVVGADATADDGVTMSGFQLPIGGMKDNEFVMAIPDRRALPRAVADADVVHLQFPFWLSFAALAEAHKAGRPVVAAFHIQPENALLNIGIRSEGLAHLALPHVGPTLYNRADAVIVPSALAQRRLVEHGLVTPSFVISNGVPPDVHPLPHRREAGHEDEFTVLMVGRLAPEKRQEDLIEAVRRSPHASKIRLVIAGAGGREPELSKADAALAQRCRDRVRLEKPSPAALRNPPISWCTAARSSSRASPSSRPWGPGCQPSSRRAGRALRPSSQSTTTSVTRPETRRPSPPSWTLSSRTPPSSSVPGSRCELSQRVSASKGASRRSSIRTAS